MPSVIDERRRLSSFFPAVREPSVNGFELVFTIEPRGPLCTMAHLEWDLPFSQVSPSVGAVLAKPYDLVRPRTSLSMPEFARSWLVVR